MDLKIIYVSGNRYKIHDKAIMAEADFLGGGGGMAINLLSIKAAEGGQLPDADTSERALLSHLEKGLIELDRYRPFIVAYKGLVVASTDPMPRKAHAFQRK